MFGLSVVFYMCLFDVFSFILFGFHRRHDSLGFHLLRGFFARRQFRGVGFAEGEEALVDQATGRQKLCVFIIIITIIIIICFFCVFLLFVVLVLCLFF